MNDPRWFYFVVKLITLPFIVRFYRKIKNNNQAIISKHKAHARKGKQLKHTQV